MARSPRLSLERRSQSKASQADSGLLAGQFSVPADGYLGLLLNEIKRELLEALLEDGPMPGRRLRERTEFISSRTFERALRRLTLAGLVRWQPLPGDKRQKLYGLTPAGHDLLQIVREVAAVEAWAPATLRGPDAPALMTVLADECSRMIPRELADGPLPYTELRSRLPELAGTTFDEHLSLVFERWLVRRRPGSHSNERIYELTELVPALVRPLARAARLRLRMTPGSAPWITGDVPSFFQLLQLAPALRAPRDARGAVLLHVIHAEGERGWPDVEVALERGRISQRRPGTGRPRASARALPVAWFDAILDADLTGIEIEGDERLARALLAAISAVVNACPRP